jgi:hypothetical protein
LYDKAIDRISADEILEKLEEDKLKNLEENKIKVEETKEV